MKHIGFNHKINEIGLKKAYNTHKGIHIDNDTMFIAGTRNFRDVYDDVTKIPVWGDLKNSKRYRDVEEEIKANPNVKKLIGHSLGSSVALEFEKKKEEQVLAPVPVKSFEDMRRERLRERVQQRTQKIQNLFLQAF